VEATGITRYGIDQYAIGSTFFPIPPIPEQQAIATYLDRQTAKIDALIAKKEHLLELLAEQRAALISQAVTKGLNPNVKLKDSGVTWLGRMPSHWKVKQLKRLTNQITDGTCDALYRKRIPFLALPIYILQNRF
jgi:type I restriction enzyme S subunit